MKSTVGCCPPSLVHNSLAAAARTAVASDLVGGTRTEHHEHSTCKPLSLRLNFSWIAAGSTVNTLCQWAWVVVLAHLGDLEMVGMVVLAFAVCAPVNTLAQLGLRAALISDAKHEYQFRDYLALRIVTAVLALLIVVGIAVTTGYDTRTAVLMVLVAVAELFKSISDILHARLIQYERMDRVAISQMIHGPLALGLLACGVCLTGDVLFAAVGFPLTAALVLFAYDLPNSSRIFNASPSGHAEMPYGRTTRTTGLQPRWELRTMLKLAWLTLPLGVVLMMVALATSIPRYMVSHYLGNHALGVFVSIAYLAAVGTRVANALCRSASPRLAKYYAAGNAGAFLRLLGKVLGPVAALGVAVVLGVALLGGPVLSLLYRADFTPHVGLAVYLMLAGAMIQLSVPLGTAVEAMRRFKSHMVIRGFGVVVLLALLPALVQAWGLKGAALAMLVCGTCTALGCASVVLWAIRDSVKRNPAY